MLTLTEPSDLWHPSATRDPLPPELGTFLREARSREQETGEAYPLDSTYEALCHTCPHANTRSLQVLRQVRAGTETPGGTGPPRRDPNQMLLRGTHLHQAKQRERKRKRSEMG